MIFAGICAGGKGERFGGDMPKQFLTLKGKPVIVHSVERFLQYGKCERVFVAVSAEWTEYCRELFAHYNSISVVEGGADRGETVERLVNAAYAEGGSDGDIIATHDAARPFVDVEVIKRCVEAAEEFGVSGAAVAAKDTVLQCRDGFVTAAPPRSEMLMAQTPQCFKLGIFRRIWGELSDGEKMAATDVCGVFYRAGADVRIVEGSSECFKITTWEDLKRAELAAPDSEAKGLKWPRRMH